MSIFTLLRNCTVKIVSPDRGTGFFVAPGWVMTCAHVVRGHSLETLQVTGDGGERYRVMAIQWPVTDGVDIDVVVLEVLEVVEGGEPMVDHPCVLLDEAFQVDDAFYLYGFPADFPDGVDRSGGLCDGEGKDDRGALIAFRNMQIQPGHSGAALLNRRTGAVCGVVNQTRGENTDYGGTAIPVAEVFRQFPSLKGQNRDFHRKDYRWAQTVKQPRQVRPQRFHLPRTYKRNVFFTGREEVLQQLHEQLQSGNAVINQVQGLSGLGGIGKTQTAVEYAYRYFEVAYDWVFWVRADTLVNLRSDVGGIALKVGCISDLTMELELQIQMALQWLHSHGSWLMVVDNADDHEVLEKLPQYLPVSDHLDGRVLITSRQAHLDQVNVAKPLPLEVWSLREAVTFLLKRTHRLGTVTEVEMEDARRLAGTLGCLPLALEQAAAFILRRKLSFCLYWKQYEKRRLKLLEREMPKTGDYPGTVLTTWQLNFDAVEVVNPAAAELLKLSAVLAPDAIPYELVIGGRRHFGAVLDAALEAEDWDEAVFQLSELLEPLSQYSLVGWNEDIYCYSIHRMVQEVLRDQMKDGGLEWAGRAVAGVWQVFPGSDDIATWPFCERILPHGLQLVPWLRPDGVWTEMGGRLLNGLGYYLKKRGQYYLASELTRQGLDMGREILGERHPDVATSLNKLAVLYQSQGRYDESESYFLESLGMMREILGERHPDVATSLNKLAALYQSQGRYDKAESYVLEAIAIGLQTLGDNHPNFALFLGNLAELYTATGRFSEAEPLYLQALSILVPRLGHDHPHVKTTLQHLFEFVQAVMAAGQDSVLSEHPVIQLMKK